MNKTVETMLAFKSPYLRTRCALAINGRLICSLLYNIYNQPIPRILLPLNMATLRSDLMVKN